MIAFKDFTPGQITSGGFFSNPTYAEMDSVLAEANDWLGSQGGRVRLLNVETVLIPNLVTIPDDEGSLRGVHHDSLGDNSTSWHQIVRVWYEALPGGDAR